MQLVQLCDPLTGGVTKQVMAVVLSVGVETEGLQYATLQYTDGTIQQFVWIVKSNQQAIAAE